VRSTTKVRAIGAHRNTTTFEQKRARVSVFFRIEGKGWVCVSGSPKAVGPGRGNFARHDFRHMWPKAPVPISGR
jgi:hypothetical protein